MSGGPNSKRVDSTIVVLTLAALADVWVAPLDEGSSCWVSAIERRFTLHKESVLAPNGTTRIQPNAGAPIAGCPTSLWIDDAPPGGLLQTAGVVLATDETTSSLAFVDILGMSLSLTTAGDSFLLADFSGVIEIASETDAPRGSVRLLLDGVQIGLATVFLQNEITGSAGIFTVSITRRIELAAGVHTLKAQWMQNGGIGGYVACRVASEPDLFYMALRAMETAS